MTDASLYPMHVQNETAANYEVVVRQPALCDITKHSLSQLNFGKYFVSSAASKDCSRWLHYSHFCQKTDGQTTKEKKK